MSSNDRNDPTHNPLADQLQDLDVEVSDGDETDDDNSGAPDHSGRTESNEESLSDEEMFRRAVENLDGEDIPSDSSGSDDRVGRALEQATGDQRHNTRDGAGRAQSRDDGVKSDRELFEEAVENLDPAEMYDAKFRGQTGTGDSRPSESSQSPPADASSDKSPDRRQQDAGGEEPIDERQARQKVQQLRDEALFHKAVGDATPLEDRDKYRSPPRRKRSRGSDDGDDADDKLLTPSLPKSGDGLHYVPPLGDAQKAMLSRFERYDDNHPVPVLHLRGKPRREAIDELGAFMRRHSDDETRFVQIVPGRGLRSEDKPVLKPAVLKWLEGPGRRLIRGYVPERLRGGDYGSLVVELDR